MTNCEAYLKVSFDFVPKSSSRFNNCFGWLGDGCLVAQDCLPESSVYTAGQVPPRANRMVTALWNTSHGFYSIIHIVTRSVFTFSFKLSTWTLNPVKQLWLR